PTARRLPPARRVEDVQWTRSRGGTRVTITTDGRIGRDRVSELKLGGEQPRLVLRLRGIAEPFRAERLAVASPELLQIRIGYHPAATLEASELHVVLDLASPRAARIGDLEVLDGRRLEVLVGLP
ncbi:MAG: hypothetical protein D6696_12530, partial [Acidobacteria bacterium]